MEVFTLFWDILKGFEAMRAFVKITRLLKDIFREVKVFSN
jgi:hypothetical protein